MNRCDGRFDWFDGRFDWFDGRFDWFDLAALLRLPLCLMCVYVYVMAVQGYVAALKAGLTKTQLDSVVGMHPTLTEELCTLREPKRVVGRKADSPKQREASTAT